MKSSYKNDSPLIPLQGSRKLTRNTNFKKKEMNPDFLNKA